MHFDISKLIDVEIGKFYVDEVIYDEEKNTTFLTIRSQNKLNDLQEKKLQEKLNFTKLNISYKEFQKLDLSKSSKKLEEKEEIIKTEIKKAIENKTNEKKRDYKNNNIEHNGSSFGRDKKLNTITIEDLYKTQDIQSQIIGKVFDFNITSTSKDLKIYKFDLEDSSDVVGCKVFVKEKDEKKFENFKNGITISAQGSLRYDNFDKENLFFINAFKQVEEVKELDNYPEKRVELEIHTKMTNQDGFVDSDELLSRIKTWNMKAVGITDTCSVQAIPEIFDKYDSEGIKVLSGSELLLVDDDYRIMTNLSKDNNIEENKDFVVFDIETTGLKKYFDKITEIGAVRIHDGKITEVFNELVNPEKIISEKIIDLTGITNEMVSDKETIDKVLPRFLNFSKDAYFVGHNADFDIGFIRYNAKCNGIDFNPVYFDTLQLSRALLPNLKKFTLDKVARELQVDSFNHHRASDDAKATAQIFIKLLEKLKYNKNFSLKNINKIDTDYPKSKHEDFSTLVFADGKEGLENLYKIISQSRMNYFNYEAKTPFSVIEKYRNGILIGSGGHEGLLFRAIKNEYPEKIINKVADFFDFYQLEPLSIFKDEIESGDFLDENQIIEINKKILEIGEKKGKLVVATGGVRYLKKNDYVLRNILHKGQFIGYKEENHPLYYLRSTSEMMNEFMYFSEDKRKEIVIYNTWKIAEKINSVRPIPKGTFPPTIDGSDIKLRQTTYNRAREIYGDDLPKIVKDRLEKELNSIIGNGYAVLYIIAKELVEKSNHDGYLVGSRGSVGSSFVATMSGITEVNPLSPHYVCPECKHSEFITDGSFGAGIDLPDKKCPVCGSEMKKDGHDIPFEVFLGFNGDKEPDIDLNFAGEYQPTIHKYTEEIFGKGKVFRAGTIGTIKSNTAYGFIKKYMEKNNLNLNQAQIRKYQRGLDEVKRTTGQHPGGLMIVPRENEIFEFTPVQYPADDSSSGILTTHFTYNMMHGVILKLDLLGHDVPSIIRNLQDLTHTDPLNIKMDDQNVMNIFNSTKPLNIKHDFSNNNIGTLGIPEFGTSFVRGMLRETYPEKFSQMTRISGLSHGTNVWNSNAEDLITNKTATFDEIISTRDDIMISLIQKGMDKKTAFDIMEAVRKGKGLSEEQIQKMHESNIPQWYIDSCLKISYLFPKAHAVAYCLMSYRIAYYKVYYPQAFYATYFTTKLNDFSYSTIMKGLSFITNTLEEMNSRYDLTQNEKGNKSVLEVAEEMYARDINIINADIYKSDPVKFLITENNDILPPLAAVDFVSTAMAYDISQERKKSEFISVEDLNKRTCLNKNAINSLKELGILNGMQESNQISFFDF
ncbi:MAG: PolC-type DNA polymerase III [Peptoniphilaceae bacterium]|nr:PolC-type DNA polymerase III [Peptoniphilaceae bacterium]MDD7382991.1 PolC-type DNA polymerase III [Peptoniphilaceae bacterium]MDY3737742.1 PolC-type DNA polymerase III [Peptoniphilaceae bacterium]